MLGGNSGLQNIMAEQSMLCAIMLDNTIIQEIDMVDYYFSREAHKKIFNAMMDLFYDHKNIDIVTLEEKLRSKGHIDSIGGLEYLLHLSNITFTTAGARNHAEIVKECAIKREVLKYAEETQLKIGDGNVEAMELISELQKKLDSLVTLKDVNVGGEDRDIANNLDSLVMELERKAANNESGLPTGLIDFDAINGGLFPSDLYILAARPGMGKTAMAMTIARNIVYKYNKSVFIASLEMSKEQLQYRLLSSMSGVELSKFRKPSEISSEEWERLRRAKALKTEGTLEVSAGTQLTVEDICHQARRCLHEHGLDLIIVDYLQLMQGGNGKRSDNRVQEVSAISRSLKTMAMELNVPVVALSQLNRGLESRNDKRPVLADLRESGSIEQDADTVMFIYRDSYYNPESENKHSELIIAKNRNGSRTVIPLFFDEKTTTFLNLSRRG